MISRHTVVFVTSVFLFAGAHISDMHAQQVSVPVKAVQLIGLTGVKQNAKGKLTVANVNLHFANAKAISDLSVSSLQDVVTGGDTQRLVGGTLGLMSMAAPYGGGRFLSLFRRKIDTLTIQYRDANDALHGAIFTMPVGAADVLKQELVTQGAHIAATEELSLVPSPSGSSPTPQGVLPASPGQIPAKIKVAAIQVEMIQSDEIKLPAEFQIALYENLVRQLEKQGKFQHVYRAGDRNATSVQDIVVLHSTVRGFKAGSERARQVTTVVGATSIKVHCQFTGADGKSLLERDLNGKVRFFGGNLKATYDFAKKAARVTQEHFTETDAK